MGESSSRDTQTAATSEQILRREYQAEVGRLREAYERVRQELKEVRIAYALASKDRDDAREALQRVKP